MAGFFPGPEESTPPFVNGFNNTNGKEPSGHGMREHRSEDRVYKDQAASNREATTTPAREAHVAFGHDGGEVTKAQLVRGEREAKIGLREGGDLTPKGDSHGSGNIGISFDGDKGAFVEIDGQAGSGREIIKHLLKIGNMVRDSANDNEGVIGILEDGAGEVIHQGVKEKTREGGDAKHLLKDVSNDVKQEGGERVSLPKPPAALDPASRYAVKENRRLAGVVKEIDPRAPKIREALGPHDAVEGIPADGVKSFAEV
jgi:hypothetical protein